MERQDDLLIPQGTTWGYRWPIVDADQSPIDVTGWSVLAQVRESVGSDVVLYEWSLAHSNVVLGPDGVTLLVTPAVSSAWTWRSG